MTTQPFRRPFALATLLVLSLAVTLSVAACEDTSEEGSEEGGEEAKEKQKPAGPPLKIASRWPGDQGYRSSSYEITQFESGWDMAGTLIEPLIKASTSNLIPSDGMKSCRYADARPTLEVVIPQKDGGEIRVISNAHCTHWAPWNVIKDGKLYVQLTGEIGQALKPVLTELDQAMWENHPMPSEGRFELSGETVVPVPDGVETQTPPQANALEKLHAWPKYKDRFGEVQASSMRVVCSQKRSATCTDLLGIAQIPYKGYQLELQMDMTLDDIKELRFPADDAELDKLLGSAIFKSMLTSAGDAHKGEIRLAYDPDTDCANMERAAETYKPDADVANLSCAHFSAILEYEGAESLPPMIKYFPSLEAARLVGWVDKTEEEFFKRIKAPDNIKDTMILDKAWVFSTLDGELTEIMK